MATVSGVNYTKITTTPVDHILPRDAHGRVRVMYDTYEASALADPSTIQLFKMPADARVIDFKIWHDALATSTTLALGDADDPDRFMAAASSASAGIMVPLIGKIDGFAGYTYSAETVVSLTMAGAAATGTIHAYIMYVVD
tara:strand:+ start:1126 stop:1548 length:423 start_codon:yes stop_codon:yes gene_type:complete